MLKELLFNNLDLIAITENIDYKITPNNNKIYGYYFNNQLVAFIDFSVIFERAELNYIYVLEKHRNQKIGQLLLDKMNKEIISQKVENITLEVNIDNELAISFYKKNGFKKVAERANYYNGKNAALMLKELEK